MATTLPPHYRPDIDGLRALAVLPVLLYHAGLPGFSGGYIGVDIFFVISGFLITGIIVREIDADTFSILDFYERRARRILPALLAMIAFVLIGASWLFLPSDLESVGPSALAAVLFMANVWLFTETGYFQADAEVTPLLHTWSLGVEEQFYIAVPIGLLLIARFMPKRRVALLVLATLASFVWAVAKQADSDGFAFYMLPTRAWELLAGSLLALGIVPQVKRQWVAEALCAGALALIAFAVVTYDKATVFPGITALAPVLAAVALIHCAPGTSAGRLLSLKEPVAIGLISYSLYLWHWPLIVFWRYILSDKLTLVDSLGLIAVSLAIAWASWRFIEQPFRSKARFPTPRIWRWSLGGMGLAAAAALILMFQGGWESRFEPGTLRYAKASEDHSPLRSECIADRVGDHSPACTLGSGSDAPTAMLWGDSHGVEIAYVLGEQASARGEALVQRTRGSCPPAIGYDPARDPRCIAFNQNVLEEIAATPSLQTVYLAGYWEQGPYRSAGVDKLIDKTITAIQALGREVVLVGPVPTQPVAVPRLLALHGEEADTTSAARFLRRIGYFTQRYPEWRARGVTIIDTRDIFIKGERTVILAGGRPLYYDDNHLSLAGARRLLEHMPGS
ncbi:putative membrane-located cell surface saccharide saccharideacetylase protein [Erythrobacter sp. NAP1]|uniref:acyltransferase family protein n=1 Tax=Erythrobacter sp. NAP1 TaxID=237727 RepID=UPI0000687943|nr:acyltransferase family protein [Erythrobacter sp. NAP1]EAQ28148.1 putative membrane-located cell surface saccharide saccharideacetylase protein [Erythrobacter sp. NAP1]